MLQIRHVALLACLAAPLAMAAGEGTADQPPPGKHMGPPPAAFTACEGKQAGDTASFTGPNGKTVSGVCRNMHGKLAVMPEHGKGHRPPPSAAGSAKACEGKKAGDIGSFTAPDGRTRSGICRDMGGKLMLVPEPAGERIEKD